MKRRAVEVRDAAEKIEALRREIEIGMEQAERGEFSDQTIEEIAASVLAKDD